MPRHPGRQPDGSRFAPLVAYLASRAEETETVTLAQIAALIGRPLSVSAQVGLSYWTNAQSRRSRDLRAAGWQAHLVVRERAVTFRRIDPELAEG